MNYSHVDKESSIYLLLGHWVFIFVLIKLFKLSNLLFNIHKKNSCTLTLTTFLADNISRISLTI